MKLIQIPARTDPCWKNPEWRLTAMRDACDQHKVKDSVVAELTGVRPNTARLWRSNHRDVIPPNHLFVLLSNLNARV